MAGIAFDLSHSEASSRSLLRLTGPDTIRFLQGTLSNDVGEIPAGRAVAAALLTVKAKLVCDVVAWGAGETLWLSVPAAVGQSVYENLDRHIIMDDVEVEQVEASQVLVVGSRPAASGTVAVLETRHPAPGFLVVGPASDVQPVVEGYEAGTAEGYAAHRVESGSPCWGHELGDQRMPPEVGLSYAVSYSKGCFMGQEPLSRLHNRGQVNRVLCRVRVEGLEEGANLSHDSREAAGTLTTVAGDAGLAIVWRKLAEPGTRLTGDGGSVVLEAQLA